VILRYARNLLLMTGIQHFIDDRLRTAPPTASLPRNLWAKRIVVRSVDTRRRRVERTLHSRLIKLLQPGEWTRSLLDQKICRDDHRALLPAVSLLAKRKQAARHKTPEGKDPYSAAYDIVTRRQIMLHHHLFRPLHPPHLLHKPEQTPHLP